MIYRFGIRKYICSIQLTLLGLFTVPTFAENYLAVQCKVISGQVNYALAGQIANESQLEWATVQCPMDVGANELYISPTVTFQDNNPDAGQDVSCFTRGRTKDYGAGSLARNSVRVSTIDVDADGYTGVNLVDELYIPQIYLGVTGGAAMVECDLPPATGPSSADRSKLYLYESN